MKGETGLRICIGLLAVFCAIGLARAVAVMGLQVPLDPNEGWNAYHAMHAMSGGVLYPDTGTLLYNNYPPLSYWIVGTLGSLTGDNILAGRILSLLATLAVALGIAFSTRRMKVDLWCGVFSALLFVAGLFVFTDYVGMDDPQMLGHAIAMAGLLLLLKEPRSLRVAAGAAVLMTLAVFVKHNLIALPIALAVWLAFYDRRSAIGFVLSGAVFALIGLLILDAVCGVNILSHLHSPRLYSFDLLTSAIGNWLVWANISLFGLAALFALRLEDKYVVFAALYAFVAILMGALFAGGAGVDTNIWFDAMIGLSIGVALTLDRLTPGNWRRAVAAAAYALPLGAGLALNWDDAWLERDFWLHPLSAEAGMAHADIAFFKAHEGSALCEMLSLCYWAGKRAEADVFNLGQAYATHARSDDSLVRLLDTKYYRSIEFDSLDNFALTPSVKQALLRDYRIDHQNDEGVFLMPR